MVSISSEAARKTVEALTLLHHPSLSQALKAFTSLSQLKQTHAHLIISGLTPNLFTTTRLLACAALSPSAHNLSYAAAIFQHFPKPSLFMYNTMLRALSYHPDRYYVCFEYYKRLLCNGFVPDKFTFPFVVRACWVFGDLGLGQQVHCHILKFGLGCDVFVVNHVLNMYLGFGELHYARNVFEECLGFVDVVSWTSLISGCWSLGEVELARWYFDVMPCKSVVSWNVMISGLMRIGRVSEARKVFDEMPERDVASWGAMVSGYSQCGMGGEALRVFREMVEAMVVPNLPALVSAVSACAQLRALDDGVWLHDYIVKNKFDIDVTLGTALLDMYGRCGYIERAVEVFNCMAEKNVLSWNSMIASLAMNGFGRLGLSLFWQMQLFGLKPNDFTFIALFAGCSHSGLVDEGLRLFGLMTQKYKIKPQREHYGCVVDLLGRAGMIEEALKFVQGMPVEPHPELWGSLVGACSIHEDIELGRRLGKHLINLDLQRCGRYALLSNLFASARRWDDVEMVRKLMKDRKVLKSPGNSVVES
ncbi:pentatricopeptide repeat-containing protein At4g18840-like [Mangifera indica]|uniref:pentatricopeptide repeat-containing protein At4g18840-like n=1 Tax=Mangifera indica TaxID=29780 RepID=UPI001CFB2580|nr:pentatricopeptide repeat-containing protein At4g18840-like [Mangifera indica]